ncbi:hypothetical protein VZT92_011993 [Zoarces viviparus]|uniref:Uncharacterized protein n=1 Tax=Zoarces viviparus TaxID=48416 RepID=A0AAW1F7F7_ZOAVI
MTKIYAYIAGKTLNSHQAFLQKLTKKGAKVVESPEKSDVIIVFCPIVSRYKTDIESALSNVPGDNPDQKLILVAMHHTFDKDYIFPKTEQERCRVVLHVDCLFHEGTGLLTCPCNKEAVKMVRTKLKLGKFSLPRLPDSLKKGGKEVQVEKRSDE